MLCTSASSQAGDFNYICTATPYVKGKTLVVKAFADEETPLSAKVTMPGAKYYLIQLALQRGKKYRVTYTWGDEPVFVHREVTPPSDVPYLRVHKLSLEPPVINSAPQGYVILQAQTENKDFDATRMPDVKIKDLAPGGSHKRGAENSPPGAVFCYVKPGFGYRIDYYIGGKHYTAEGTIGDKENTPTWTLKEVVQVDCDYIVGEWGDCIGGRRTRSVSRRNEQPCKDVRPPASDTVCTEVVPDPDPLPEPDVQCTGWDSLVGPCVDGRKRVQWTGVPTGCRGTKADTFIKCAETSGGSTPTIRLVDEPNEPEALDSCERHMGLKWNYVPVMELNSTYTLSIVISEEAYEQLQREARKELDLDTIKAGRSVIVGDRLIMTKKILIDLVCSDPEAFTITAQGSNRERTYRGQPIEFMWSVKPLKSIDEAEFIATPSMDFCDSPELEPRTSRRSKVKVTVKLLDRPEQALSWLEKNLGKLSGLLALIAGIVGYFKGWFGNLFKKKEKKEEGAA